MIGLKRHIVELADHDPGWGRLGVEACQLVKDACSNLIADVQHVGSTAVPGLPAKPVLDLAAAVTALDIMPRLSEKLSAIGYVYEGDCGDAGGRLFVLYSEPDIRIIHLHVVELGGAQWKDYLRLREILRQDFKVRKRYAGLKLNLCRRFPNNRGAYTSAKHAFIREILDSDLDPEIPTHPPTPPLPG